MTLVAMDLTLLGYFPKERFPPPQYLLDHGVVEVGSVSLCLASGPDGWMEAWEHNEWGYYRDPHTAWSMVPGDRRSDFRLYAFELYPAEFDEGRESALPTPKLDIVPLPSTFRFIGWDAVSRSAGMEFECSPLSCNHMVEEIRVNEHCLVDFAEARGLALTADESGCEPGPYHVVKVWRHSTEGEAPGTTLNGAVL